MAQFGLETQTGRTISDLRVVIDRSLLLGLAECVDAAGEAVDVGDDVVEFVSPEQVSREGLIQASKTYPVEALKADDSDGTQLVPDPAAD